MIARQGSGQGTRGAIRWGLALAVIAAAPLDAWAQAGEGFDGTYLFSGSEAERSAHDRALEKALEKARPVTRPVVGPILRKYLCVPRSVVFRTRGDLLSIALDPYPAREGRLDGTVSHFKNNLGQRVSLRRVVEGSTIVESVKQGKNVRLIRYDFAPGRERLTISWSVSIPAHLESPIRYSLTFTRQ